MPSWTRLSRERHPLGARRPAGVRGSWGAAWGVWLTATVLFVAGCSGKTILAVDPFPCPDASASGCPPGLLDDLVGFWRLNDGTGSTVAHDSSGWANDGKLVDLMPTMAWAADGPERTSLAPQGKGYVEVPDSPSIDSISKQVTMAAWMYVDSVATNDFATAISRQTGTNYGQVYHLSINGAFQPSVFIWTDVSHQTAIFSSTSVAKATWVHVAATYDGQKLRLYLDGQEVGVADATGVFTVETNPVVLGGNGNGEKKTVSELVNGRLDDVMLYRRALSAEQIAKLSKGALSP